MSSSCNKLVVSPLEVLGGESKVAEGAGELVVIEDMDNEVVIPNVVLDVYSPTEHEVKEHEISHLPFRNWCAHCVRGKGLDRACGNEGHVVGCIPCVLADYMFLGEKEKSVTTPVLVVKDDDTESVFPNVVPKKGAN